MADSIEARVARSVTPERIDAFRRDGAVPIRGLFSSAGMSATAGPDGYLS
jgi:hypothetical protein